MIRKKSKAACAVNALLGWKLLATAVLMMIMLRSVAQDRPVQIMLVGSDHLSNIYRKDNANTDVLSASGEKSLRQFRDMLVPYKPDAIMIEALPSHQSTIDSLYTLFLSDKLDLGKMDDGRSEIFTLAFPLAKAAGLTKINCVNAPGGTSQGILDNGDHIDLYKNEGVQLRKVVSEKYAALQSGALSFRDFLIFLNQPITYNLIYHLRYITPARVTNGTFSNPDPAVDTAFVDNHYIGAELISVWKNRDYKIYSNIVSAQLQQKSQKIMVLIGVAHIGSLKSIFRDDPAFSVTDATVYLKTR